MCDKGLTGLANIGNTCYLNSCIQILSNTDELSQVLDKYQEGGETSCDSLLLLEWNSLRRLMWSKNCVISPNRFVAAVQKVAKLKSRTSFISFDQNDTQEFWMFLIECLHNSLARKVNMRMRGRAMNQADKLANACYKKIKEMFNDDYSEMVDLFYGMEVTFICRLNAEKEILSFMPEPFSVISLPIPSKRRVTLHDCFDAYCANEEMKDENAWFNDDTDKKEDVLRHVKFWSLPKVLVVNLNRWNFHGHKVNTNVDVPLDNLDLSKYVNEYQSKSKVYSLYGVCNHKGGSHGGHYTAHVRNANGKWYEYDDTQVTRIQNSRVISGNSYCLFFRRV